MAEPIIIYDNTQNRELSLLDEQWKDLHLIAGRTIKDLCGQDEEGLSLLVFPDSLDEY